MIFLVNLLFGKMESELNNLFVKGIGDSIYTIKLQSATFSGTKISELKNIIQKKSVINVGEQRLIYNGRELYDVRDGKSMAFKDYDIQNNSNITLTLAISGGTGLLPLKFVDITSKDKFKTLELSKDAPQWRIITRGLNFVGICKKPSCVAYNNNVWVMKEFYDSYNGLCLLNSEITELQCPMCKSFLAKKNVTGLGIYKCRLNVQCKQEGKDKISYEIVAGDKMEYAGCYKEKDKIEYEYIKLIVKPLEDLSSKDVDLVIVE